MRHDLPIERVRGLDARGLRADEVAERRARFGANDVVEEPRGRARELALETAKDPMLWFLIATSAVYASIGQWTEAGVLCASIVPLAGMDVWLHHRTQASTRSLQSKLATRARVLRDGRELDLASNEVVVGDIALVGPGESFPADGVLLAAEHAQVDESALTGEAFPIDKSAWSAATSSEATEWIDGAHCGLAGTRVLSGRASLRVVAVGGETLYGGIVRSTTLGERARTPLQTSIAGLVRALLVAATALCIVLALVRWRQGHGWVDAWISALTLAIAALPEEFPVVFSVFLGVGVLRLGRRGALVRRAVTVENIGRVSTICSDKTGTLTEGRLRIARVVGFASTSELDVLRVAARASQLGIGDPLDDALGSAAGALAPGRVLARFPFTEDRKRETVVTELDGELHVLTKGAPETVVRLCAIDDATRALEGALGEARLGRKVIACASQRLAAGAWIGGEPAVGFELRGLVSFEDPLRSGAREAIEECTSAGIRTIVVTGDHPETALAVARELGLGGAQPRVVLGDELEPLLRAQPRRALEIDVVARAVPSQKLALVRALQACGEIVAVTGDGVNDVPALQAADVGIAMGERGTRSARETAAIVLLHDDFASIVGAIGEGRQLFRNLQAGFQYLLMIHLPLVLTAAAIPLAGYPLLYMPIHVIWIELMIHPTAMLAFQELPPRVRLHREPPRARGAFFSRRDALVIALVGVLLTAGIGLAFHASLGEDENVEHARAMALVALTLASATVTGILTGLRRSLARWIVASSIALAVVLVQTPWISARLHLSPLHATDWALAAAVSLLASVPLWLTRTRGVSRD
ncbi:MAG: cation-transporting P-type ATPase [Planctomycetes bacterium]|nr:cation-transporting P-type ATPase [Planctomycetota bacterium]